MKLRSCITHLQSLVGGHSVNLGAEVGSGGSGLGEVLGEDWLEEGAEDKLSTTVMDCQYVWPDMVSYDNSPSLWESKPEGEDKLEGVVEWEPVDGVDQAFKDAAILLVLLYMHFSVESLTSRSQRQPSTVSRVSVIILKLAVMPWRSDR